jgi:hypothetical protein
MFCAKVQYFMQMRLTLYYKKTIKTLKCKNKKADRKNRKYISCQLLVCIQLLEIMYKYRKCILCEIIV